PLLDETSLKGAKAVLVNITGGLDMTLLEVDEAANAIASEVDGDANIIFGAAFDPSLDGKIRVSVVATGMDEAVMSQIEPQGSSLLETRRPAAPASRPVETARYEPARPEAPRPADPVVPTFQAAPPAPAAPSAYAAPRAEARAETRAEPRPEPVIHVA